MLIQNYFPELDAKALEQFAALPALYAEWNSKINVISRKDIDNFEIHHLLHSLAIAKYQRFEAGSKVIDLGTGGGLPAVPLAILFPDTEFILVDSIGKKLKVAQDIADELGLANVRHIHSRVEDLKFKVDFVIARAVAPLPKLMDWTKNIYSSKHKHACPNGLWALKGLDAAKEECKALGKDAYTEIYPLAKDFPELPFFETKALVYAQA